jgi:DNA-binding transcriptional MerR regulator
MRIKELAEVTGVSKTSIHYYTREKMLHPGNKGTRNSALYDESHIERLAQIKALRGLGKGVEGIKRILAWVDKGVDVQTAMELDDIVQEIPKVKPLPAELDKDASGQGKADELVATLNDENILAVPAEPLRNEIDRQALESIATLIELGVDPDGLVETAKIIRESVKKEITNGAKLTQNLPDAERAKLFLALSSNIKFLKQYLNLQARNLAIRELGLAPNDE